MSSFDRTPPEPPELTCEEVLDRLEAYVDGDLPLADNDAVRSHLEGTGGCPTCARELAFARSLLDGLRALPEEPCPQAVVERAFERARGQAASHEAGSGTEGASRLPRPANEDAPSDGRGWWIGLAAAAALLVAFGLLAMARLLPNDPATSAVAVVTEPTPDVADPQLDPSTADADEIARATEEARLALALVASISRRSALVLRDDVVGDNIIGPSARALQRAMQPLRPLRTTATPSAETGDPR